MNAKDFLDPLAVLWALMLALTIRRLFKGSVRARKLVILLLLVPILEGCRVSARLVASLEAPLRNRSDSLFATETAGCRAVVVCGGMLQSSPDDFSGANYSDSVDRFLTGVSMARHLHCPLVLGGGLAGGELEPVFLRRWAAAWNLTDLDVRDLGVCRDTRDEAASAAAMGKKLGWTRVLLVSSAWHLPRAAATFRRSGLEVAPYGCDFEGTSALEQGTFKFLPSCASASLWRCWITELAGLLYYRCRGWA